uniref:Uncharacterized protein n=1 Tax=Leersia perrieri TaxID=77586 RepID=A0A0D9WRH9_9ORYZ
MAMTGVEPATEAAGGKAIPQPNEQGRSAAAPSPTPLELEKKVAAAKANPPLPPSSPPKTQP